MDSDCKTKYNLDHMYCHPNDGKYIRANNAPTEVLSILKENKKLKGMLLLHLDLIQEQSDQLTAKDRLLASLREENEMLKLRIERMDKRLQRNNKTAEQVSVMPQLVQAGPDKKVNIPKLRVINNKSATITQLSPPATETKPASTITATATSKSSPSSESKYKICDDNYNVENHILGHNNGKYITKIVLQRVQSPNGATSPHSTADMELGMAAAAGSRSPTLLRRIKSEATNELPVIVTTSELTEDNFSCGSGTEQEHVTAPQKRRKNPVRYGNMVTKKLYCSREWEAERIEEDLNREESEALQSECPNLEIPKWTIKEFHGLYAIEEGSGNRRSPRRANANQEEDSRSSCESKETAKNEVEAESVDSIEIEMKGTEDLSDDVFLKRHNKLEIDERRRKKWDFQRIREQRTIERLKRRQNKELIVEPDQNQFQDSFYPNANQVKFIQIKDEIPVNAFGEIIPRIKDENFNLPWPETLNNNSSLLSSVIGSSTSPAASLGSVVPAASTIITSATSTSSVERCTRRTTNSNFNVGSSTALLILKKRRRQPSHSSNSKRSHRKIMIKN